MRISVTKSKALVLADHMDGRKVPIIRPSKSAEGTEAKRIMGQHRTTEALLAAGLLKTDSLQRSRFTMITEAGREALSTTLSEWAEVLSRVQMRTLDNGPSESIPARKEKDLPDFEEGTSIAI